MITCPQCGAPNADDVKFCDRCGQGLAGASARSVTAAAVPPLAVGTELKHGLRVVELIGNTVHENRYRAERQSSDGKVEHLQLREQIGPARTEDSAPAHEAAETNGAIAAPSQDEDPAGPRAKTADLRLKTASGTAPSASERSGDTGGLAT